MEHQHKQEKEKNKFSIEPLTASIYVNTVYGHEFWVHQPSRYPDGYYKFISTKCRLNTALEHRFTRHIPPNKCGQLNSISLFYEVSSCDLYICSKVVDHHVPWKDVLGFSLGVEIQRL